MTKEPSAIKERPTYDKDIAKRFAQFRLKYIADSQAQAARELKCNQAKISLIESAGQSVDYKFVALLIKKYQLNAEWLSTGIGNMRLKQEPQKAGELITNIADLKSEIEILKKAIMIMQVNQNHFIKVIQKFMDENNKSSDPS